MDVSVIIVNYNTRELTRACIDSVYAKTRGVSFEIILIDNASTDGSKEFFERDSRINYIYNTENLGFGRANILGYQYATGRNIFLLNPDTILLNNAIKELSNYIDNHPNVAICGGNLYSREGLPTLSHQQRGDILLWLLLRCYFRKLIPNQNFNHTHQPLSVKMVSGANMMIRRTIIEEIGFFDPDFFMYLEDNEFCHRVRKHHYKIVNYPGARIMHLEGQSSPSEKGLAISFRGRALYIQKTHSKGYLWLVFITEFLLLHLDLLWVKHFRKGNDKENVHLLKLRRRYLWQSMKASGFSAPKEKINK